MVTQISAQLPVTLTNLLANFSLANRPISEIADVSYRVRLSTGE